MEIKNLRFNKIVRSKKQVIISLTIAILILLAVVGVLYNNQVTHESQTEFPIANVDIINQVEPSIDLETSSINANVNISDQFEIEDYQKDAKLYSYKNFNMTDEYVTKLYNLIKAQNKKDLEDTSTNSKITIMSNDKESITIDYGNTFVSYLLNDKGDTANLRFPQNVDVDNYEKVARNFAKNFQADIDSWKFDEYTYIDGTSAEGDAVETSSQANAIMITYHKYINGIPIIDKNGDLTPNEINILLFADKTILKGDFQLLNSTDNVLGVVEIKPEKDVRKDIENGQIKLISGTFLAGTNIKLTNAYKAKLAYYNIGNTLVPVYVVTGMLFDDSNMRYTGYLVVDAIKRNVKN